MSTDLQRPSHLDGAAPFLDGVLEGGVRLCLSAPPRHAKSTTACFHLIAWFLKHFPHKRVAYCCYSAKLAENRNRNDIRPICEKAGIDFDQANRSAGAWMTKQGGGVWARGVEGAITGFGFDLIVIDDPFRDRSEAESPTIRENVWGWFTSTAFTRLEPNASVVCTHTRWHADDLIGRIEANNDGEWTVLNFEAIKDGKALWSGRYSLSALQKIRQVVGEYDWASLYMGQPRPRGQGVFNATHLYDTLPDGVKYYVGLDLAYTEKTWADWSVAVVLAKDAVGNVYVVEVLRKQLMAPKFIAELKLLLARYSWPPVFSYVGGIEKGITDFFATQGVKVKTEMARADKHARAQPVAALWNQGRVFIPRAECAWKDKFISEVLTFTGSGDAHDDQVDALASGYAIIAIPPPARGIGTARLFPF